MKVGDLVICKLTKKVGIVTGIVFGYNLCNVLMQDDTYIIHFDILEELCSKLET